MQQNIKNLNFSKYADGLIPAIIQDETNSTVLMLGFMNQSAIDETLSTGKVCFFSRTKQRLWTKGEESGNFLLVRSIHSDCDDDTLLIKARPVGPVCHTGNDTCFNESNNAKFLNQLEEIIRDRLSSESEDSHVRRLASKGINAIAQKVGEEAVELVIEAKDDNEEKFMNEAADLLFHYLVLLNFKGKRLNDVETILESRHKSSRQADSTD